MPIEPLIIKGRIVTLDKKSRVIDDGVLYVGADEHIAAIKKASEPAPEGFESARVLDTGGSVYPGMLDLHNHIAYNTLPLWASPTRAEPWGRRDQWPDDPDYKPSISLPANAYAKLAGEATLKYVETKAVTGGTTAIQGSAKVPHYDGWLVRNVEKETFKKAKKISVRQSVRELEKPADFAKYRKAMDEGYSFLYHLAEGQDPVLIEEFTAAKKNKLLHKRLLAIHSSALTEAEFKKWRPKGSIIWSPFSNLWLYGHTTPADEAAAAGQRICLGADWSPSATKNLLGELKVADICNRRLLKKPFSDEQLVRMTTSNPAEALGWQDTLGSLTEGLRADVLVASTRDSDPYRNLISAREKDVEFVAINGYPFYGTKKLMRAAGATHAEPIRVAGQTRSIVLLYPGYPEADMTWAQVQEELESVRSDPKRHEQKRKGRRPGGREVRLQPEKFRDARVKLDAPTLETVELPSPDALWHDSAFFRNIERRGFHGGLLNELQDYYR